MRRHLYGRIEQRIHGGQTMLTFQEITIPASGNCTVSVVVVSNVAGMHPNTNECDDDQRSTCERDFEYRNADRHIDATTIAKSAPPRLTRVASTPPSRSPTQKTDYRGKRDGYLSGHPGAGLVRAPAPNATTTCTGGNGHAFRGIRHADRWHRTRVRFVHGFD